jgi:Nitrosopumilus output domain 1
MPFKIRYKFKEDKEFYTCIVTHEQFKNFKKLPIVKECEIIKNDEQNIEEYKNEMQEALNLAAKNDTSHIRLLSQIM